MGPHEMVNSRLLDFQKMQEEMIRNAMRTPQTAVGTSVSLSGFLRRPAVGMCFSNA